jgi:branched-chain amino acid transport system ATP-binding protein
VAIALECEGLTKSFEGLDALKEVTFKVEEGQRRAILGPNGAGKTTLFNLISGGLRATSGRVRLFGRDITKMEAHKRVHLGLGRTFQITNIFHRLTVLDNLILSQMGLQRAKYSMLKPMHLYRHFYNCANEMLERINRVGLRNEIIKNLSYGTQRQIEIAMTLITNPKILLFDEPTAGLSPAELNTVVKMIKELDSKITILVIEHDMDVAFELSDYFTVLNFGEIFIEGTRDEIKNNKSVREIYLGAE